ncbi:hypothetical protein, partial [Streptomyces clavifer]|uniref:hypothetical protein n=1 Tax=Streptomyces clavifer TaxID=68188 RepID=UPI002380F674
RIHRQKHEIIIDRSKIANRLTKSAFSVRPIEKSTRQMSPACWYRSMSEITWSSDVDQHVDPSMIIARRIPKDTARPATLRLLADHLMQLIG